MLLRNGLTYSEASANANRLAKKVYDECVANGQPVDVAQLHARNEYEKEMCWYEAAYQE